MSVFSPFNNMFPTFISPSPISSSIKVSFCPWLLLTKRSFVLHCMRGNHKADVSSIEVDLTLIEEVQVFKVKNRILRTCKVFLCSASFIN